MLRDEVRRHSRLAVVVIAMAAYADLISVREELFRGAGLEDVSMLAGDWVDPGGFVQRLQSTYRRAG